MAAAAAPTKTRTLAKYGSKIAQAGLYALSGYEVGRSLNSEKPSQIVTYEHTQSKKVSFDSSESHSVIIIFMCLAFLLVGSFALKMFYKNKFAKNPILPTHITHTCATAPQPIATSPQPNAGSV